MNSTDSINSCTSAQYNRSNPDCGRPGVDGSRDKLPKDVLEAMEDNDLEKAMALLRAHNAADDDASNYFLANLIKTVLRAVSFNFIVASTESRGSKKVKNSQKKSMNEQQLGFQKILGRLSKMFMIPMNAAGKIARAAAQILRKAGLAAGRHFFMPAAGLISKPFVKSYNALRERFEAFSGVLAKIAGNLQSKYKDIRVKASEKLENAAKEIRELAKPVKNWLNHKFENFAEKQQWAKEALGQHMQVVVHVANVMINVMAYTLIPFAFGLKQARKGEKFLKRSLKKLKGAFNKVKSSFNKGKNWLKGKMKQGYAFFQPAVQAFVLAIERVWFLFLRKVMALLKKLLRWIGSFNRILLKGFKLLAYRMLNPMGDKSGR